MKIRIENLFMMSLILIAAGRVFCRSPDLFGASDSKASFARMKAEKPPNEQGFIKLLKDKLLKYAEHDELALGISYLTGNKDELTAL